MMSMQVIQQAVGSEVQDTVSMPLLQNQKEHLFMLKRVTLIIPFNKFYKFKIAKTKKNMIIQLTKNYNKCKTY